MLSLALLLSCMPAATRAHINSLDAQLLSQQAQLQDQQTQIAGLEGALSAAKAANATPARPSAEMEAEASALNAEINAAIDAWDFDTADALLKKMHTVYPNTRSARGSARTAREIAVVGMAAPSLSIIQTWYTQPPSAADTLTVMVFWEAWCPHCRRELPNLRQMDALPGVGVVALTKITKSSSDESVRSFIQENQLEYAIGFDADHSISDAYSVTGIPAAAVVRDGVVIWRGHPAKLSTRDLERARDGKL